MTVASYITNRPTSPAMAAAIEAIERTAREAGERKAAIRARFDSDPRMIQRRAAHVALKREYDDHAAGMNGGFLLIHDMLAGMLARRAMYAFLIRARRSLIEGYRAEARQHIRDAICARRQQHAVTKAEPGMLIIQAEAA
jgi:hypothetical protein